MQRLLSYGDRFAEESTWKDFALLKLCMVAIGIMWGMTIPKKSQKTVGFIALIGFITSYIPLMSKLFRILDEGPSREI